MRQHIEIFIEIVSFCNFKCLFCGHEFRQNKKTIMSYEDFKGIVYFFLERFNHLQINLFSSFGESFLHPNIYEIISFCSNHKRIFLSLITNGVILFENKKIFNKIKESLNIGINVSLYGKDYKEFSEITKYEGFSEKDYNDYLLFLKYNNIPIQFRTLQKEKTNLDLNIIETLNTYASWTLKPIEKKEKSFCPCFLTLCINSDMRLFPCAGRSLDDECCIGMFTVNNFKKLRFVSNNNIDNLVNNYIKFGKNGIRMCSKCNFPEIKKIIKPEISYDDIYFLKNIKRIVRGM